MKWAWLGSFLSYKPKLLSSSTARQLVPWNSQLGDQPSKAQGVYTPGSICPVLFLFKVALVHLKQISPVSKC